jgi:nucleotide-binding universal stress UspA family protein
MPQSSWREVVAYRESWANDVAKEAADLARQSAASVEPSQESPLLVVGSRLGLTGLLLGSVSYAVLHRAQCPVAVIRGET